MDLYHLTLILGVHCLCLLAPFQFTWGALWVAISLYLVSGMGVTISYHQNLAHQSFKVPKWLEYSLAYCAVLSLQGSPLEWVSSHRYHHQFTDKLRDPHSPTKGFWFSHVNWAFDYHSRFGSVSVVVVSQVTFSINSICHTWGKQIWDTGDASKNNWLFGLLAFVEGWHNNHHAFEYSARQGLE
ncbi:putative acyl-CoA desaturase [Rosa chinensis]|uniref:Putative acyl-CoA desaturase n=1 Tax=Rosa chinensis TaxID=74649 RepID=A0A2P6SEC8_ROSCH|nr:putative acyl-CoA desaturase [Rosa chinensis]